jgi:hypothetical protein
VWLQEALRLDRPALIVLWPWVSQGVERRAHMHCMLRRNAVVTNQQWKRFIL